jgi:hypothetical protein
MTRDDVQNKARELVSPRLGEKRVDRLIELVWTIDTQPNLKALVDSIAA